MIIKVIKQQIEPAQEALSIFQDAVHIIEMEKRGEGEGGSMDDDDDDLSDEEEDSDLDSDEDEDDKGKKKDKAFGGGFGKNLKSGMKKEMDKIGCEQQ